MTEQVSELESYRVPPGDLTRAEYCFRVTTSIAQAPKDDPEIQNLKRILTGLLNTTGGIIYVRSTDATLEDNTLDKWRVGLWEQLETFLPPNVLQSCVHLERTDEGFQLWVKRSPKLITLTSSLHTRGFAHSKTQYDASSILDVMKADTVHNRSPLNELKSFQHMAEAKIQEDQYTEMKCWKNVNKPADYKKRFDQRTKRALFSLANVPSGGDMLIGISEDKESKTNCVVGQKVKEQDQESLKDVIKEILCGEKSTSIWGSENCHPQFKVTFLPIENADGIAVIRIRMEHCKGGAFENTPESYIVSDEGLVEKLSFEDWKALLVSSEVSLSEERRSHPHGQKKGSTFGSRSKQTSSSADIQLLSDTAEEPAQADLRASLQERNHLSWTTDRSKWYENIIDSNMELGHNVLSFIEEYSTFKLNSPFTLTPVRDTILARYDSEKGISDALSHIQNYADACRKGFGVASPQWASNFNNDAHLPPTAKHLLDILSVDDACNINLWTLIQEHATELEVRWSLRDILVTGRLIKRRLLFMSDFKHGVSLNFQIHCHVYKLVHGECIPRDQNPVYAAFHKADPNALSSLIERLAYIILEKETLLKDMLGKEFQIRLTAHQMEKILSTSISRFNMIYGPPGCGKTYMALHMTTKYQIDTIHYLCTTKPFQCFLEYQGLKFPILIETEQKFLEYIERDDLEHIRCIIIDDVQLLDYSSETWNKLFKRIYDLKDAHLCLFADCAYQNFKTNHTNQAMTSMMTFCMNQGAFHLCQVKPVEPVIHRNHKKLVSFIKSCFEDAAKDNDAANIACSQQKDGDDVEIRFLENIRTSSEGNGLVTFVNTVIGRTSSAQIKVKSRRIAILVDTVHADEDAENFRTVFGSLMTAIEVHDATVFPVRGLTIDILDNFVGLDRDICIVVTDERLDENGCDRSTNNPKYKAFAVSRGITRVVIVVGQTLDLDMASKMKMVKLSMTVKKQDKVKDAGGIRDLCFLEADGHAAVFHITFGNELGFVTMDGEHAALPVARSSVNVLRCTASTADHGLMVMVDCDDVDVGPWRWTLYARQTGGFEAQETHEVDGWPWSLCFAPDNSIIMIVKKGADFRFRNYLRGGQTRWDHCRTANKFRSPRRIRVGNRGQIYVADFIANCIYVFTAAGVPCGELPQIPDPDMLTTPHGVAVAPSGHWLLVSHFCTITQLWVVSMLSTDGLHMKRLPSISSVDRIWSLDLYHERFLAVGTEKNLYAYDIHDVF